MNRHQRRAAAKAGKGSASSGSAATDAADTLFEMALRYHQGGALREAERVYREILARQPGHAATLGHLGILYMQAGQSDEALPLLKKAAMREPENPVNHFNLGLACSMIGQDRDAIAHNRRAVALKPDYVDAHINLGESLIRGGHAAEAIEHFTHAAAISPSSLLANKNLASALLAAGRTAEALTAIMNGLDREPGTELKGLFAMTLPQLDSLDGVDVEKCRAVLLRALQETWRRPGDLANVTFTLLKQQAEVAAVVRRATAVPRGSEAEAFAGGIPSSIAEDALLAAFLRAGPVMGVEAELVFTALRRALLARAGAPKDAGLLPLTSALAEQCFLNEYVFAVQPDESVRADELAASIDRALAKGELPSAYDVAVSACYAPLARLAQADRLLQRSWAEPLPRVIKQQIADRQQEDAMRASIEQLTPIDDETSQKVRAQYEANPYPRWTNAASIITPLRIDVYLQQSFPGVDYRPFGEQPLNVLIAGCGTGREVVETVRQFGPATTLAVDLSLSSLAHAARKAQELGIGGVRFAQADILKLGSLGQQFDLVVSGGVLHHLRDPIAGWRTLLGLVREGGMMRIALYSAPARTPVQLGKAIAAGLGGVPDAQTIHRFRQAVIDAPPDAPIRQITKIQDFYTLSECRDLVFHVMDNEFDLPAIAHFLTGHNLTFIGFETPARAAYLKRFPDDPAATDLDNWHQFELENPTTFRSMYQFWVQKRD